jgi:hypothetical protein
LHCNLYDDEAPHAKEDEEKLSPFMFGFVFVSSFGVLKVHMQITLGVINAS